MNDAAINEAIAVKLSRLEARADQQPVSYIQLFRDAHEIACEQFKRAMAAEAEIHRLASAHAAAPALLAALKMLREIDDAYGFDLDEPQRDQMHDAIAKAEGRAALTSGERTE